MPRLDRQTIQKLKTRLDELPQREPLRPYDLIVQLAESFSAARTRGYDIGDLVQVLKEEGIHLTRNTVRNYLSRARATRPTASSIVARATTVVNQTHLRR
jgi:hypothetical protein